MHWVRGGFGVSSGSGLEYPGSIIRSASGGPANMTEILLEFKNGLMGTFTIKILAPPGVTDYLVKVIREAMANQPHDEKDFNWSWTEE